MSVLRIAKGGDTIQLAPGTYSGIASKTALSFDGDVTITSQDPSHQAVITDFHLTNVKGLTFTNLDFAAQATGGFAFEMKNATDVHFDHVHFHGSLDGNSANDPSGLGFSNASDVSVTNSEFEQLLRAMAVSSSDKIDLSNNRFHDLRSDGVDLAQVSNVKIAGNTFANFTPSDTDHPDAIQFWTSGTTTASHDIVITDNVIMKGTGAYTQGIFLRDQVGTLPYEHVTISDNLIVGTGYNGIRIQGVKDLKLTGNDVVSLQGDNYTNILIQGGQGVTASGNHTNQPIGFDTSTGVVQTGNVVTKAVLDDGYQAVATWKAESAAHLAVISGVPTDAMPVWRLIVDPMTTNQNLIGDVKNNELIGGIGNDTLEGRGGADTLSGGAGDDVYVTPTKETVIIEKAGGGNDTVVAVGEHTLGANIENLTFFEDGKGWRGFGNELDNRILGNSGSNALSGGAGNDTIDGGLGNDTLLGDAGSDRLTGGAGADVFRFAVGSGKDVITDFGAGPDQDLLDIQAYIKAGIKVSLADIGGNAVVSFSNGDSITLQGVHASDMGAMSKVGWLF